MFDKENNDALRFEFHRVVKSEGRVGDGNPATGKGRASGWIEGFEGGSDVGEISKNEAVLIDLVVNTLACYLFDDELGDIVGITDLVCHALLRPAFSLAY